MNKLLLRKLVLGLHAEGLTNKEVSDRIKESEESVAEIIKSFGEKSPPPKEPRDGREL